MNWLTQQPIAHRGLHSSDAPENTLNAFDAAIEAGYPIECDVRLSADGVPVVFHDRHLGRLTDCDAIARNVPYDKMRELNVLDTDQTIPRLADVLAVVDGQVPLLVEVKSRGDSGKLEEAVARQLDDYDGQFAVQAFNPLSVSWFRQHRPAWPRGQLAGFPAGGANVGMILRAILKRLFGGWLSRPDFIGYEHDKLPYQPVTRRKERGLPVLAWTIRTREDLTRVTDYADNVIFEGIRP